MFFDFAHFVLVLVVLCAILAAAVACFFILKPCYKRHRIHTIAKPLLSKPLSNLVASKSHSNITASSLYKRYWQRQPSSTTSLRPLLLPARVRRTSMLDTATHSSTLFHRITIAFTRKCSRGPMLPTVSTTSDITPVLSALSTPTVSVQPYGFVPWPTYTPPIFESDVKPIITPITPVAPSTLSTMDMPSSGSLHSIYAGMASDDSDSDSDSEFDPPPTTPVLESSSFLAMTLSASPAVYDFKSFEPLKWAPNKDIPSESVPTIFLTTASSMHSFESLEALDRLSTSWKPVEKHLDVSSCHFRHSLRSLIQPYLG
jgi:hypothetical protein